MQIPDFLEPYRSAGQKLLSSGAVKGLVFSGPTYQVEVHDPALSDPLWVFLQFNLDSAVQDAKAMQYLESESFLMGAEHSQKVKAAPIKNDYGCLPFKGKTADGAGAPWSKTCNSLASSTVESRFSEKSEIKDLFCSCEESTEKGACSHMAAAFYYVVPEFLHFEASFWHHLFLQMQEKIAPNNPKAIRKANSIEVPGLFTAEGDESFCQLFKAKPEETEETSIKFSNLSEDELERWRTGHPSLGLRYELSFLSDVAKWFFTHQDSCQVFIEDNKVTITCKDVVLKAHDVDLLPLIPTLNTVSANLRLLDESEIALKQIEYDPITASFIFHKDPKGKIEGVEFGKWLLIPKRGFVLQSDQAKKSIVRSDARIFTDSLDLIKKFFDVDETPRELSYSISLDKNLRIQAYVNTPGDLDQAPIWGDWTYLDGRFIKLAPRKFNDLSITVPKGELSNFLMTHRLWLSQFDGFYVHVAKLEEQILYDVDKIGNLTFRSVLHKLPRTKECRELGDWLYVAGDGFYVKNFTEDNPPLSFGREIPSHLVAEYIRHHLELLQGVPGFFSDVNPLAGVGLKIWLKKKGVIEIVPEYEWNNTEDSQRCFFYDEFVFVQQKGFYRLPLSFRPVHLIREISSADPQAWAEFFQELLPKLKNEYRCTIDPRLEQAEELALTMAGEEAQGNWAVDISWKGKKGTIAIKDLLAAKKRQVRFLPTEAGVIDLTEDRFRWLDTVKDRGDIVLRSTDFLRITAYDTIHVNTKGRFKELLERLLLQKPTEPIELSSLTSELRPYQKNGVDWLWFLYQNDLSGLLCDDMGVGKTHQAMGLMDGVRNFQRKNGKKSLFLVVCPTSLVYHWEDKLERFLPTFKTKVYVGTQRSLDDFEGDYDILLTSYGIWRNESKKFLKYLFDAAFFDELQIAKNHVSQIHNALLQVQAPLKVGLTGTPIENHLRELKSLFDLVLPGYMPFDSDYREFFMRPIERGDNPKRRELLSRFVRPFVLRRRKKDVLPDLPVKTEDFAYCELAAEQKSLYKTVASQQAEPLIRQLRDEDAPIPYMHIFAVISALKQICNHPAAYLKDVAHYESYESGKWEAFVELLEEAMESEQKVVVFSQFLAMLDIMGLYLKKNGIGYAEIRGQTKNRGDEVQRFHDDPSCKVFLGSLQAAGLGIDLTPASIVIHYDRWWNAARENQATDRVHRIGQVRGVQVLKLLTKATIEERIDQLITKKSNLLEDVVFFDDHQIVKRLSRQEIISLLQGLPE